MAYREAKKPPFFVGGELWVKRAKRVRKSGKRAKMEAERGQKERVAALGLRIGRK